jgi:hypothetical protein
MCTRDSKSATFGLGIKSTRDEFLDSLEKQTSQMIDCAAHRGDQDGNARASVRDIHNLMKEDYEVMIHTVGNKNIFPLIVAADIEEGLEGVGSSFTLYRRDGSSKRINVVSKDYEFYKALSHMPLGLFTIISAYFNAPKSINWVGKLQVYRQKVDDALYALDKTTEAFDQDLKDHAIKMLTLVKNFINDRIEAKEVPRESFEAFSADIYPYVYKGLKAAAKMQAEANLPALRELKNELGPKEWREVYVVIPTVWPVSGVNPRQQILAQLMDKDRIDTHIILTENAFTKEAAKSCVGRVVADRAMAQLFFGVKVEERRALNFALSSKRDLISDASELAIAEVVSTWTCEESGSAPAAE